MNLRYIALFFGDVSEYEVAFKSEFLYHVCFLNNFLSKEIRKLKYRTDGTFKMIAVNPTPDSPGPSRIMPEDALVVEIDFDRERYESIKGTDDCNYYLELFDTGFRKAAESKDIPIHELLDLLKQFRADGCKNTWVHRKRRFKDHDIQVTISGSFTTNDITISVSVSRLSSKSILCSGPIIKTLPDELFIEGTHKEILVVDGKIVITDFLDRPTIEVDLAEALRGKLVFDYRNDTDMARNLQLYSLFGREDDKDVFKPGRSKSLVS